MQRPRALLVLELLSFAFLFGAFGFTHLRLQECTDGLEEMRLRLGALDQARRPVAQSAEKEHVGAPAPIDRAAFATAEETETLRRDLDSMRRLVEGGKEATQTFRASSGDAVAASTTFSPAQREALESLVREAIEKREQAQVRAVGMGDPAGFHSQRRQKLLDDLERRLQLSLYQKETIGELAQARADVPFLGLTKDGPPPPEELARILAERDAEFDGKVKAVLTARQADEYDGWRKETGGFGGMVFIKRISAGPAGEEK